MMPAYWINAPLVLYSGSYPSDFAMHIQKLDVHTVCYQVQSVQGQLSFHWNSNSVFVFPVSMFLMQQL